VISAAPPRLRGDQDVIGADRRSLRLEMSAYVPGMLNVFGFERHNRDAAGEEEAPTTRGLASILKSRKLA
jgi:hypothetical protein